MKYYQYIIESRYIVLARLKDNTNETRNENLAQNKPDNAFDSNRGKESEKRTEPAQKNIIQNDSKRRNPAASVKQKPGGSAKQNQVKTYLDKVNKFYNSELLVKLSRRLKALVLVIVAAVLFYSPFPRGLFFERETLYAELIVFGAFALFWLSKILSRDKRFLETPLDYAALLLVGVYFLAIFGAVAKREAIFEWVRYCTYFAVFLMVSELAAEFKHKIRLLWVLTASAVGVCILALDAVSGSVLAKVLNKFFEQINVRIYFGAMTDYGRLASTFQYVNALAGYLIVAFFVATGITVISRGKGSRIASSAASFLIMLVFIHTLSRGAFIVIPFVALIYLVTLPRGSRIKGLAYMLAPVLPAFLLTMKLTPYMNETEFSGAVWLLSILGAAASSLITVLLDYIVKYLESISWKVYTALATGIVAIAIAAVVVVLTVSAPLVLSNYEGDKELYTLEDIHTVLEPGREYKLVFDVQADMKEDVPFAYRVEIYSRNEKNILFVESGDLLNVLSEKATDGVQKKEISFKVPTESRIVDFNFINHYPGTKATFNNASIVDASTGKIVKNLILKYKFMPQIITTRLKDLQANKSGLMRGIYYRDGLKMFSDYPLIGAGGGAWKFLFQKYQSYDYYTTQAHNFILQLGVETGIIGLLAFLAIVLALLTMFAYKYFSSKGTANKDTEGTLPQDEHYARDSIIRAVLVTAILGLLMHSFIDFDLSYTSMGILLWLLMGLFSTEFKAEGQGKVGFNKKISTFMSKLVNIRPLRLFPAIGLAVAIIVAIQPINFARGISYGEKAIMANESKNRYQAMVYMSRAAQVDPYRAEYKIDWANLIKNQENLFAENIVFADNLMLEAEKLVRSDSLLTAQIGSYFLERGDIEKGLKLFDTATELKPLRSESWQQRVGAYFNVVLACFVADKADKGLEYIDKTLAIIDDARQANTNNLNPFIFNKSTSEMLERLKYIKDNLGKQYDFVLDDIIWYSMPGMDINFDNIPDQWNTGIPEGVNIKYDKGLIKVENTAEDTRFIRTRELTLLPGGVYTISVYLSNYEEVETIPFQITGVTGVEKLDKQGVEFSAEITIPADFKPSDNYLRLGVAGKYDIITMSILGK